MRVHPSPSPNETNASTVVLPSPANATLGLDNDKCFTKQLSFGGGDEFFHGMLSYRVNSEGPNGNNLASLLWDSCCHRGISLLENPKADGEIQRSIDAVNQFGKWPKIFPHPSSSGVRIFLDQKNLRPGYDWKGTGNRADGGFLGALSSSLTLIPLLSATPARFKIKPTGSEGRYQFTERGNFTIQDKKPLDIFCESVGDPSIGKKETKHLLCTDFRSSDNSFMLKSVGGEALKPESIHENASFWTPSYILPSDGSGPKGSVSEMLTIMQTEEDVSFHVKRERDLGFVTLEVVELSDHVFFKTEKILLQLDQNSQELHEFAIDTVAVQGSKIGKIKSVIQINCGENTRLLEENENAIYGKTKSIDRKDNVLIEFMLARALSVILAADTNPHPCKIILPVFVDDICVILGTSKCLSTEVSRESAEEVKKCLLQLLKKDAISLADEQRLINVSIRDAVLFFSNLQGCQLSKGENRSISMEAKSELVSRDILSTVGIEAESYARELYVSNNPLAHELLDFINQQDMGHIERSLVKFDVTSVKTFSKLSSESIKSIAEDSLVISKKSKVREIADITCAIDAAKDSPYIMPVSRRLAIFEDTDASFMTIIYSTFAFEQGSTKPFFGKYVCGSLAICFSFLCAYQFYKEEFVPAVVNLPRAMGLCAVFISVNVLKSVQLGRSSFFFCFAGTGSACIAAVVIVDKFENGSIDWDSSHFCISNYDASKQSTCMMYQYLYYGWQAIFWLSMAVFVKIRQEVVWRVGCAGTALYLFLNLAFHVYLGSVEFYDILGVVFFPALLIVTEVLKYYGTLKAIRTTENGRVKLSKLWDGIKTTDNQILEDLSKIVEEECSFIQIQDHSKDMGKWKATFPVRAEPPKIHQPTSNFDELYLRASTVNDTFQMWIGSIFLEPENRRNFVYEVIPRGNRQENEAPQEDNTEAAEAAGKNPKQMLFKGKAIRGPVKRPHRAIAKVCIYVNSTSPLSSQHYKCDKLIARFTAAIVRTSLF
jgi:hypothetical protein